MIRRFLFLLAVLMIGLLALGCAKKVTTVSEAPVQEEAKEAATAEAPKTAPDGRPLLSREDITEEEISKAFEMDTGQKPADIYFDYDRYEIKSEARPVLMKLSDWMLKNRTGVVIEGHCDDRGTTEYNLALGDKRAEAAKNFLISTGVPAAKIDTVSFGEERPLCREQKEPCWSKNRRAHFVLTK